MRGSVVTLLLGATLLAAVASARTSPRARAISVKMPGPAHGPRDEARLDRNDECVTCHADIAHEWQHSLHRQSFEDPMFQAALAHERHPAFCRSCHAPEADPRKPPSTRAAAAGVACVSCHLSGSDDAVLAGPRSGTSPDDRSPHALRRSAAFAAADACAGCHEFWFPSHGRAGHELKMQRTISEHERSAFADDPCQRCHMPPARGDAAVHHEHRFAVAGQAQMLRAAVRVEASRPRRDRVVLELWPHAVGHAVPTGDLFRRLCVELEAADAGPPWSAQRVLGRRFADRPGKGGALLRVEHEDDRVGVHRGPTIVEFELPPALRDRPLRWQLVHERALDVTAGADRRADIWDRTPFMSGEL